MMFTLGFPGLCIKKFFRKFLFHKGGGGGGAGGTGKGKQLPLLGPPLFSEVHLL